MKLRLLFITTLMVIVSFPLCAQKTVKVKATYTYHVPASQSQEEAKRVALERAKLQALADEFGTIITQSNTTVVRNENGQSSSDFFSLGGSEVKGEWIETIGTPVYAYDIDPENGMQIIIVTVEGHARKEVSADVELDVKVLRNGTEPKFASTEFRAGDDMFLYFKSPINGYLAVYLLDETSMQVYCLLPYMNSGDGSYEVKHDKPYVFFSAIKEEDKCIEVDEYNLTASREVEHNALYIVFSPNEFVKANSHSQSDLLPRHLSFEDFQRWLGKVRRKDSETYLKKTFLTIRK